MAFILLLTLLLSFFTLLFYRFHPKLVGYFSALASFAVFIYFARYIKLLSAGGHIVEELVWVQTLGIHLRFYLDGLSLFFVLLISFFGSLILGYSTVYMLGKKQANRFFFYLILFMSSMLAVVLSDNIFLLYISWELTSISSYLLISFDHSKRSARDAALQALLVTNLGGLALFAGLLLIGNVAESYNLSTIIALSPSTFGNYSNAILVLMLIGCFTKSAQFPFHFWLPNAMSAPTPVSAFLHSATMVKAGVFLLMRFNPLMAGVEGWHMSLLIVGGITMILGAFRSLLEDDLKKILAYITVSTLGLLVAVIGVGTKQAIEAALLYLLVHAFYKGALFLLVGNIDKKMRTRNINELSGLFTAMPFTGVATILACLAMAGLPPFLGFIAKEKLYDALIHHAFVDKVLFVLVFISSSIYFMLAIRLSYGVFFRKSLSKKTYAECPFFMWAPPAILALLGLVFGVGGSYLAPFLTQSYLSITGDLITADLDLSLWHGMNSAFVLGVLTWITGFLLYRYTISLLDPLKKYSRLFPNANKVYLATLASLGVLSYRITLFFQNGYLTRYLKVIFAVLIVLLTWVYIKGNLFEAAIRFGEQTSSTGIYEWFPLLLILVGCVIVLKSASRLRMLVSLSLIGYGIAFFYAIFSAPDVSMTQFLVETITLVVFTIILHRLPKNVVFPLERRTFLIATISIVFGIIMTLVLIAVQSYDLDPTLKNFYLEQSAPLAHGENVVNVMLVDFRAFDTFGEIVVLCMTAIGVVALINLKPKNEKL